MLAISRKDLISLSIFAIIVLSMPLWLSPFGAAYPGLMQKFAIYAIFAIGFNILFGLTGYLSFGHAAFLGVGSRSEEHTSELQSRPHLVCRLLLEKKKNTWHWAERR